MGGPPHGALYGDSGLDETLARSWRHYRNHLELVVPFALFGIASLLLELRIELFTWLFDFENGLSIRVDSERLADVLSPGVADSLTPVLEDIVWLLVLSIVAIALIALALFLLAMGIAFLVAADVRAGRQRAQFDRTLVALRRLPALFVAAVLTVVLVGGGLLLFVVPGLYIAGKVVLAGPAIVIDGHGPVSGLGASWRASSGQFLQVFGVVMLGPLAIVLAVFVPYLGELVGIFLLAPVMSLALATVYLESPGSS